MSALIIFGASLLAVLLFTLETLFKALASACSALLSSLGLVFTAVLSALAAVIALCIIALLGDALAGGGLFQILLVLLVAGIGGGLIATLVFGFGTSILEIVSTAAGVAFGWLIVTLEAAAELCEKGYTKFLTVIIKRVEKC